MWSSLGDQPWENAVTFQAARQRELELMASCRDMISFHALPCTLVGFGNSGFASKLKSLSHALRLEEFTDDELISMIQEIVTTTQDYDTEKAISRLKPEHLSLVCPHVANFDQQRIKEFDAPSVVSKLSRKKIGTPLGKS